MADQVEVQLSRMSDVSIHHGARRNITLLVRVSRVREEPDVVTLLYHQESHGQLYFEHIQTRHFDGCHLCVKHLFRKNSLSLLVL